MSLLDELKVRLSVETGKFNRDFDGAAKHVKAVAKEILDVTKSIERGANSAGRLAAKITLANMTALEKVAHFSAQVQALRDADLVKEETYQRELVRLKKKFMETDPKVKADAARAKAMRIEQIKDLKELKAALEATSTAQDRYAAKMEKIAKWAEKNPLTKKPGITPFQRRRLEAGAQKEFDESDDPQLAAGRKLIAKNAKDAKALAKAFGGLGKAIGDAMKKTDKDLATALGNIGKNLARAARETARQSRQWERQWAQVGVAAQREADRASRAWTRSWEALGRAAERQAARIANTWTRQWEQVARAAQREADRTTRAWESAWGRLEVALYRQQARLSASWTRSWEALGRAAQRQADRAAEAWDRSWARIEAAVIRRQARASSDWDSSWARLGAKAQQQQDRDAAREQAAINREMNQGENYADRYQRRLAVLNDRLLRGVVTGHQYGIMFRRIQRAYDDANPAMQRYNRAHQEARDIIRGSRSELENYQFQLRRIQALHRSGHITAAQAARAIQHVGESADFTSLRMRALQRNLNTAGQGLRSMGMLLTVGITAPVTLMAKSSVTAMSKLDNAITESVAVMGGASKEIIKSMHDQAQAMSETSIFAADELATGYYHLASAGLSAEEAMKALPIAERFATAGAMELEHATNMLIASQTALGLRVFGDTTEAAKQNAQQMKRVSDVLVLASNKSLGTVSQFSEALTNKAAAAMRIFGVSVEMGVAALALFHDRGITGAHAGEMLAIVLRDLSRAAVVHKKDFEQMGITVFNVATEQMQPLSSIIKDLEKQFSGLTSEGRIKAIRALGFQWRSVMATLELVGGGDKLAKYHEQLKKALGTTEAMADIQMQSFSKQMKTFQHAIQNVGEEIGRMLIPKIMRMVNWVKGWIKWWKELTDGSKALIVSIAMITAVLGPLLIILGRVAISINGIISLYNMMAAAAIRNAGAVGTMNAALLATAPYVAAAVAIYAVIKAVSIATDSYYKFNEALEKNIQLSAELERIKGVKHAAKLGAIGGIEDPVERIKKYKEELARAEQEMIGLEDDKKTKEKQEVGTRRAPGTAMLGPASSAVSWLKNKIWKNEGHELAIANLEIANAAIVEQQKRVQALREEILKEGEAAKRTAEEAKALGKVNLALEMTEFMTGIDEMQKKLKDSARETELAAQGFNKYEIEAMMLFETNEDLIKSFAAETKEAIELRLAMEDMLKVAKEAGDQEKAAEATKKLKEDVDSLNQKLDEQIKMFGLTGEAAAIYALEMRNASKEDIDALKAKAAQLKVKEDAKKDEEELDRLKKKHLSPQEKYNESINELNRLYKSGKMGIKEYRGELDEARKALQEALNVGNEGISTALAGSIEVALLVEKNNMRHAMPAPPIGAAADPNIGGGMGGIGGPNPANGIPAIPQEVLDTLPENQPIAQDVKKLRKSHSDIARERRQALRERHAKIRPIHEAAANARWAGKEKIKRDREVWKHQKEIREAGQDPEKYNAASPEVRKAVDEREAEEGAKRDSRADAVERKKEQDERIAKLLEQIAKNTSKDKTGKDPVVIKPAKIGRS
jgi:TP901 family phage tail tape measure protein